MAIVKTAISVTELLDMYSYYLEGPLNQSEEDPDKAKVLDVSAAEALYAISFYHRTQNMD
jgi:hypothetical protein